MNPCSFEEHNAVYGPPHGLEESQVSSIFAHITETKHGSMDGCRLVVVAWMPTKEEIEQIINGSPIFLSVIGGLPPHFLTTSFQQAINPA